MIDFFGIEKLRIGLEIHAIEIFWCFWPKHQKIPEKLQLFDILSCLFSMTLQSIWKKLFEIETLFELLNFKILLLQEVQNCSDEFEPKFSEEIIFW